MELQNSLTRLATTLESQSDLMATEEATKNALTMPLINALGYNVFDPTEVQPEFTADVGMKKGEKVDYAIIVNGEPTILIECKSVDSKLDFKHASQLFRYFGVTQARFAILTNGQHLWFYTDLDSPNRMDSKPFFKFNLLDFDSRDVAELQKFSKAGFDLANILENASELKYTQQIGNALAAEIEAPTDELVKHLTSNIYEGRFTAAVCDQFRPLVKSAFRELINERLSSRLKSALQGVNVEVGDDEPTESPTASDDGIVTTVEEIEGFHIVRAILAKHVAVKRVVMRDTKSYCGVLLDDNNRKPICRLHFNAGQKYIGILSEAKDETRHPIEDTDDVYKFEAEIIASAKRYVSGADDS